MFCAFITTVFMLVALIILMMVAGVFDVQTYREPMVYEEYHNNLKTPSQQLVTAVPTTAPGDRFGQYMTTCCYGNKHTLLVIAPGCKNGQGVLYRIKCDYFSNAFEPIVINQQPNKYQSDFVVCGNENTSICSVSYKHSLKIFNHIDLSEQILHHPFNMGDRFGENMTLGHSLYVKCEDCRWGSVVISFETHMFSFETVIVPSQKDISFGDKMDSDSKSKTVVITGTNTCYIWRQNVQVMKLELKSQPIDVKCTLNYSMILLHDKVLVIDAVRLEITQTLEVYCTNISAMNDYIAIVKDDMLTLFKYCSKKQNLFFLQTLQIESGFKDILLLVDKVFVSYPNNFNAGGCLKCYNFFH